MLSILYIALTMFTAGVFLTAGVLLVQYLVKLITVAIVKNKFKKTMKGANK